MKKKQKQSSRRNAGITHRSVNMQGLPWLFMELLRKLLHNLVRPK